MVKWVLLTSSSQYRSAPTHQDSPPHTPKRERESVAAALYPSFDLSPCDFVKMQFKLGGGIYSNVSEIQQTTLPVTAYNIKVDYLN
jgi:hypothetical protein